VDHLLDTEVAGSDDGYSIRIVWPMRRGSDWRIGVSTHDLKGARVFGLRSETRAKRRRAGDEAAGDGLSLQAGGNHDSIVAVTFSDVVRAHRVWETNLYEHERENGKGDEQLEKRLGEDFCKKRNQFEQRHGRIEDAYWSVRDASAVALTLFDKPTRLGLAHEHKPRFHRATDWATRDEPRIAEALDDCETLAVRVEEILRGPSELIALRRINAVASHLLGYVDREWFRLAAPDPPPAMSRRAAADEADQTEGDGLGEAVERQRNQLREIEGFYTDAADGQARILTFWGMVEGLVAVAALTGAVVFVTWSVHRLEGVHTHWETLHLFVISVMAGASGAFLSVLSRMASPTKKFTTNFELGRKNVRWMGIYRSFVGAIFGGATFLMLASGILQTQDAGDKDYAYYGILAFFSGFFERFTKLTPTGALGSFAATESPAGTPGDEGRQ
jgi:hypothetical protein